MSKMVVEEYRVTDRSTTILATIKHYRGRSGTAVITPQIKDIPIKKICDVFAAHVWGRTAVITDLLSKEGESLTQVTPGNGPRGGGTAPFTITRVNFFISYQDGNTQVCGSLREKEYSVFDPQDSYNAIEAPELSGYGTPASMALLFAFIDLGLPIPQIIKEDKEPHGSCTGIHVQ